MKTLIWKELRENGKWAVLAAVVLGLAEFYGLTLADYFHATADPGNTLCKPSLLTAISWGCGTVGFILALLQILPEQRRDQWAALLHRPVRRETIFLSKVVAGLVLYFFATLPPFIACAWYAFTPGHFAAPVLPGMMTPGLVDIAAGAMFYAAGLFVALKRGPWYGPRLTGAVGALIIHSITTTADQSATSAIVLIAIMFSLIILAGRGAIQTNGPLSRMGWPGRVGTVLLTLVTFNLLVPLLLTFSIGWADWLTSPQKVIRYVPKYVIDLSGKPFIVKKSPDSTTDLAGNIAPEPSEELYPESIELSDEGNQLITPYYSNAYYIYLCSRSETDRWFYVKDQKRYLGYSLTNNLCFGSIGLEGFKGVPEVAKPFEQPGLAQNNNNSIIQSARSFYLVNVDNQTSTASTLIYTMAEGERFYGAGELSQQGGHLGGHIWLAIALNDHIQLVDVWSEKRLPPVSIAYDHDPKIWDSISISQSTDSCFIIQYLPDNWYLLDGKGKPSYLEKWDFQGMLVETTSLPRLDDQFWSAPAFNLAGEALLYADVDTLGMDEALAYLSCEKIGALAGSKLSEKQLNETLGYESSSGALLQILLVSIVFAGITYYWARRMEFSRRRAFFWALLVFATNLPGFITFRLLSDWPQRVPCPVCRKHRSVSQLNCPHCKQAWPLPKRDGSEIFEPAHEQIAILRN